MKLVDVYDSHRAEVWLYELLAERPKYANISHKKMPSLQEHRGFLRAIPYANWYLIQDETHCLGACYISRQNEIGIAIFKAHRRKGYAKQALKMLMEKHPGEYYANIAPRNKKSMALFKSLGFHHIQNTYKR